ncbi:MAG TPA: hypothetical protein VGZ22_29195, partial [Isosphaeraceae bacterium]|nr:hypothetical protein [Isosphaeraceae bacterium]
MQRIIKTVLPCVFGAWAACAAFGQAPGDPRSNEAPQTSAPRKANLKAKAAADAQVKPAQGPAFAPPPRVADAAAAKLK